MLSREADGGDHGRRRRDDGAWAAGQVVVDQAAACMDAYAVVGPTNRKPAALSALARARDSSVCVGTSAQLRGRRSAPTAGACAQNSPLSVSPRFHSPSTCLLYTSDAADDLLCVDLGGR